MPAFPISAGPSARPAPLGQALRPAHSAGPSGRWLSDDATAFFDIMALIESVEPVPVRGLIGYLPEDLDMLLRTWLRVDPQMRCPGNPKTVAERVWLELAAVTERVNGSGEAGYPVGLRVTQEPDFTGLRTRWHRQARDEAAWLGVARDGTTLEGVLPGSGHADGFADQAATMPGAGRPRGAGHPGTGPNGAGAGRPSGAGHPRTGPNGAGPGSAHADEEDTL